MLVNILDLEAGTPRVRQFVDSLGDAAREWPALRMAALRGNVQVPSTVSADLPRPPTPVNRQRRAVLDGLGALLDQAHRHWDASAANGNAELAAVAGGIGRALPLVDHASGDVSASPGPPRPRAWVRWPP